MKPYFKKDIDIRKNEQYTAQDFLNEKTVKDIFEGKTTVPGIIYVVILYAANIPEADTYQITKNLTMLTKSAYTNPGTNEIDSKFDTKKVEGHVNDLFNLVRPCDKLLSVYISDNEF